MSNAELMMLMGSAAVIAVVHTLIGPDHYVPFIALARSRQWALRRTIRVTLVCGLGHVAGSVLLGAVGIAFGLSLGRIVEWESLRGTSAGWALLAMGLTYAVWGLRRVIRQSDRVPERTSSRWSPVTWALFVVFVLGPCEPLIPFLIYPAANHSLTGVVLVAIVFTLFTLATMVSVVSVGLTGLDMARIRAFPPARYTHSIAGSVVALCGFAILIGL